MLVAMASYLAATDDVRVRSQHVHDFALALVAPLGPQDHRHLGQRLRPRLLPRRRRPVHAVHTVRLRPAACHFQLNSNTSNTTITIRACNSTNRAISHFRFHLSTARPIEKQMSPDPDSISNSIPTDTILLFYLY